MIYQYYDVDTVGFRGTVLQQRAIFQTLMHNLLPDVKIQYDCDEDVDQLEDDSDIMSIIGNDSAVRNRVTEYLRNTYHILEDIYSQDITYLHHNTRRPLVLYRDGEYLGHIYLVLGKEWIGIRASWKYILDRVINQSLSYDVAGHILLGCYAVAKREHMSTIRLSNPIGMMSQIAQSKGFVNDCLDVDSTSWSTVDLA